MKPKIPQSDISPTTLQTQINSTLGYINHSEDLLDLSFIPSTSEIQSLLKKTAVDEESNEGTRQVDESTEEEQPEAEADEAEADEAVEAEDVAENLEAAAAQGNNSEGGSQLPPLLFDPSNAEVDSLERDLGIFAQNAQNQVLFTPPISEVESPPDVVEEPCPCNILLILDVSLTMFGEQLDKAKDAAQSILDEYASLNVPLNISVIAFASNFFQRGTRTEEFGDDVVAAKDHIDDLNLFYEGLLIFTEYDDAVREAQDVLEDNLSELPESYKHKVFFISDAEPTPGEGADQEPGWQTFIAENNIDVIPIAIMPDVDEEDIDEAYGPVGNPGDETIVINSSSDIDDILIPNLPVQFDCSPCSNIYNDDCSQCCNVYENDFPVEINASVVEIL